MRLVSLFSNNFISYICFVIAVCCIECSIGRVSKSQSFSPNQIIRNHVVKTNINDTFLINLHTSANGYYWNFIDNKNVKLLNADSSLYIVNNKSKERIDGGRGLQIFKLVALKKGKTNLEFELKRPFGKSTQFDSLAVFPLVIQ